MLGFFICGLSRRDRNYHALLYPYCATHVVIHSTLETKLIVSIRREGVLSGINRIYRLYREEGLGVRKRNGRKRAIAVRAPIFIEARPNARCKHSATAALRDGLRCS